MNQPEREHIDFDKIPLTKAQRKAMEAWFKRNPPPTTPKGSNPLESSPLGDRP